MTYIDWFSNHIKKRSSIINKLIKNKLSKNEIIEYFNYKNMKEKEKEFCPLYKDNKKCHVMEKLNCFLCACPYFRFDDNAPKIKSYCSIKSKFSKEFTCKGITHLDCSDCLIPHKKSFIKKHCSKNWKEIMKKK